MESSSSSSPDAPPGVPAAPSGATPAVPATVEYVGFWKRFVAFLIDTFIAIVVAGLVLFALYGKFAVIESDFVSGVINVLLVIATILFWRYRGATPGKMAIAAKIVDAKTLGAPSTGRLVVRYFAYLVSILPVFIGFVWIGIDRRKQGFHDKIVGTVGVYDDD